MRGGRLQAAQHRVPQEPALRRLRHRCCPYPASALGRIRNRWVNKTSLFLLFRTEGPACLAVGIGTLRPAGRLAAATRPHSTRADTRAKSGPLARIAAAGPAKVPERRPRTAPAPPSPGRRRRPTPPRNAAALCVQSRRLVRSCGAAGRNHHPAAPVLPIRAACRADRTVAQTCCQCPATRRRSVRSSSRQGFP